jgi:DNA adenine methylase
LKQLLPLIPAFDTYCEPFLGGGALLFALHPNKAIVGDSNAELINVYSVIKKNPADLIESLKQHKNEADYFYEIRSLDRDPINYAKLTELQLASRFIYLNKTCYNGLYRVNNAGQLNAPFGRYKNPNIVNSSVIQALNTYFNENDILFNAGTYKDTLSKINTNKLNKIFVYLDPPYDPISQTASFTGYTANGFSRKDQEELKQTCDSLNKAGIKFMLSNSDTEFINELYKDYNISKLQAKRSINSNGNKRGNVGEVVVRNYE